MRFVSTRLQQTPGTPARYGQGGHGPGPGGDADLEPTGSAPSAGRGIGGDRHPGGAGPGVDVGPLADLVAARDDLPAGLHVHVTPWTRGAQSTQGMQRVYRHALREGLISSDVYRVLSGTVGAQGMRDLLGVPAHRLWATAVHQQVLPAGPGAYAMNRLVKQEFGMARADRQRISERLAPMALSAYRSQEDIEQALRAFCDGGTITDRVWKQPWTLTKGSNALEVLDDVLDRALAGETGAVAELTVLGGTAAILDGYIARDHGSKEGTDRNSRTAPFRATPVNLLDVLSKTAGGLRMLHSIARAHVAADPAVWPKQFHPQDREVDGQLVRDGEPVLDKTREQVIIDYEWDLVYAADPVRAMATIAKNSRGPPESEAEDVRQRRLPATGGCGGRWPHVRPLLRAVVGIGGLGRPGGGRPPGRGVPGAALRGAVRDRC
ncbi:MULTISPECIES: hypothetical protein [unclassified Streptomyces]|uniref:hypothetical protein n=1 Tax=unclassified Streptomyces TaxID=2593676 RepID=UPI001C23112D|nr:hypothetical protein [Streptomyces sp. AC558_RSS880]